MASTGPTRERDSCLTVGATTAVVSHSACLVSAGQETAACKGQGQMPPLPPRPPFDLHGITINARLSESGTSKDNSLLVRKRVY